MKQAYTQCVDFSLFMATTSFLGAQTWAPEGAVWHYHLDYNYTSSYSFSSYTVMAIQVSMGLSPANFSDEPIPAITGQVQCICTEIAMVREAEVAEKSARLHGLHPGIYYIEIEAEGGTLYHSKFLKTDQ